MKKTAVIIGSDVTKGARSPILWNACFRHFDIDARMEPVDLNEEEETILFLTESIQEKSFIGGAVASPLKEVVANFFKEEKSGFLDPKNCFFRNENNFFVAINTDTLAAIESIYTKRKIEDLKNICILGSGAVAKSLANHLKDTPSKKYIFARDFSEKELFESFGFMALALEVDTYPNQISKYIEGLDLIVNCTSVGRDGSKENKIIINDENLKKVNKNCLIFDVNYINAPSKLLSDAENLGIETLDGSRMNLMQAALAFNLANNNNFEQEEILSVMEKEVSKNL